MLEAFVDERVAGLTMARTAKYVRELIGKDRQRLRRQLLAGAESAPGSTPNDDDQGNTSHAISAGPPNDQPRRGACHADNRGANSERHR